MESKDCPNYETCGSASELTPEEEVELIRVREVQRQEAQQQWERIQERIRVSRQWAAVMMLMERGCPQALENLGITDSTASIEMRIQELRSHVEQFTEGCYIAPDNCEAHRYNVKRPSGTYWYNKLTSRQAIFEPEEKEEKVKVIHLSHDDDLRNTEGRLGIERRNRLHQLQTQLQVAEGALEQAIALFSEPLALVLANNENLDS
ncbi:hypothetical protein ACKFKF_30000 [Phormidesmis sp. 146-12]